VKSEELWYASADKTASLIDKSFDQTFPKVCGVLGQSPEPISAEIGILRER